MSWEQEISELLGMLENAALRFDVTQNLTSAQKNTAKDNIGFEATATQIEGTDYKITMT